MEKQRARPGACEIKAFGQSRGGFAADVADGAQVDAIWRRLDGGFGKMDILINNEASTSAGRLIAEARAVSQGDDREM